MPYRRLPNTDKARLRALFKARKMGKEIPPFKLLFSQNGYQKAISFVRLFEQSVNTYATAFKIQAERNKEFIEAQKKAKLYISHFIQVMNMAIARGELKPEIREYFGIDKNEKKVPPLSTEKELIDWGKKIISGESKRTFSGQTPITNPTIAVVRVRYDNFMELLNNQKILQQNSQRAQLKLLEMRDDADSIILQIWNEVEESTKNLREEEKITIGQEYGLVYVYRRHEKEKLKENITN